MSVAYLLLVAALWQTPSETVPLSPSEAYKSAMAPFVAAKAQPNDLTDADQFALGIGKAQATRDCLAISAHASPFAGNGKELLALGELCLFGDQYEPARATLVQYLAFPDPPERKLVLVLLIRALLGLNEPDGARLQVSSLLRDYPYDAQIHFAIDQVIDAMEAAKSPNPFQPVQVLQLCQQQNAVTLPLLSSGKALEGKEISASASTLFIDAVRCAGLARSLSGPGSKERPSANPPSANPMEMQLAQELHQVSQQVDTLQQLSAIVRQPDWAGKADLAPMQAALARQLMVGVRAPLSALHAHVLGTLRSCRRPLR